MHVGRSAIGERGGAPEIVRRYLVAPTPRVPVRKRVRVVLLLCIGLLFVLSVPWYRSTAAPVSIVWGLPDWVAVALACYVLVAVLNSIAWLLGDVPDPAPPRDGEGGR